MTWCSIKMTIINTMMMASMLALSGPVSADTMSASAASNTLNASSLADILINRTVIDNNDETVGTIDHVSVDRLGRIDFVVIDVSEWLRSEKRISLLWKELSVDSDGNVRTTITKDFAKKSPAYMTQSETSHIRAMTRMGDLYDLHRRIDPDRADSFSTRD